MEEVTASEEHLYQLWMIYMNKTDTSYFRDYLKSFLYIYKEYVDVDFQHFNTGFTSEGPHLTRLPDGILQVASKQLGRCSQVYCQTFDPAVLQYAEDLVKCLIVICRNLDNIAFVASCEYVGYIVSITTVVINKLCQENTEDVQQFTSFVNHSLHFFEVMYDPYFHWRRQLRGWQVDRSRCKFRPACLHVEVIPFFYECFQQQSLELDTQFRLLHVFGGIICGTQSNALKAICPATLDVLTKVLTALAGRTTEQREEVTELKELVLKCFVRTVHVVHCSSPDQRQVEVGAILESYFQVLLKVSEQNTEHSLQMQLKMLSGIEEMLLCPDKPALQVIFVAEGTFDTFVTYLQKPQMQGMMGQRIAMAIIRVMNSIMAGSSTAKDKFKEKLGYTRFVEALKSLGQPSKHLLKCLLDLVVESVFESGTVYDVKNTQATLMLIQWLPDIQSHDLQLWLTESLHELITANTHNRLQCCQAGVVAALLRVLQREQQVNKTAVEHILALLESLGTLSITGKELKLLLGLLRPTPEGTLMPYASRLMQAMSKMGRKEGRHSALYYFDCQAPEAGIVVPGNRKWPGTGFTFHAWVCLNHQDALQREMERRQIYSFTTSNGTGFEAFFSPGNILVVASCVKKEYHTVMVADHPISDNEWHCIDVVHTCSKRPFTQSQLTVYIDGRTRHMAQLKFPYVTEPFSSCVIGWYSRSGGSERSVDVNANANAKKTRSRLQPLKNLIPSAMKVQTAQSSSVTTIPMGCEDDNFGALRSFQGQLGSICMFHEALQAAQIQALNTAGPNSFHPFSADESNDLPSKLLFHFNAKASQGNICIDLSGNNNHGRLMGIRCETADIKDAICCIGGIQVLFPLLDHIHQMETLSEQEQQSPSASPSKEDDPNEWVMVRSSSYADSKLNQNNVAGFLILIRNFVQCHRDNQDSLVRTQAISTLGALLQRVEPKLIDVHVLMAIQLLVETVAEGNKPLLYHIYQYLLFDFRIWSRSEFPVRIGHIQYLNTIIKEDRAHFRKKYGVQYILDTIRTYYGDSAECKLQDYDSLTIRKSLFGLVKFYVMKEITFEELNQLLAFTLAVKEENMITEALELLITLLESPGKKDQIYLLLYEQDMAEPLYHHMTNRSYSTTLLDNLTKLFTLLLSTDRVSEKYKTRLRLPETGLYPGMVSLMVGRDVSMAMITNMLEQVLMTESPNAHNAMLCVVQLLYTADLDTKLEATRRILKALFSKSGYAVPKSVAKQLSWQAIFVRLFILNSSDRTSESSTSSHHVNNENPSERSPAPRPKDFVDLSMKETAASNLTLTDSNHNLESVTGPNHISSTPNHNLDRSQHASSPFHLLVESPSLPSNQPQTPANASDALLPQLQGLSFNQLALGAETPLFAKKRLFDDLRSVSEFDAALQSSRSSSTSVEDLHSRTSKSESSEANPVIASQISQISVTPSELSFADSMSETASLPLDSVPLMINQAFDTESKCSEMREDSDLYHAVRRMGLILNPDMEMTKLEEFNQNLLIILFTLMWKGIEGSSSNTWKDRGQVLAAVNSASENYDLTMTRVDITRNLIEMMLQGCIMDLKENGQTSATVTENALVLIRNIYYFLCFDDTSPPSKRFNERIIEDVMTLLDLMTVWDAESGWREMEQLGLSILLAFAAQSNLDLCSIAAARLHTLLQTRPSEKLQESCYVMGTIENILTGALEMGNEDHYAFLIPVMKALVDKCHDLLNMATYLPSLPATTMSPTFFDDFKQYCFEPEWRTFMDRQVLPSKDQYMANMFDEIQVTMKTYAGECHEQMMIDSHRRNREKGESKLRFQDHIGTLYSSKSRKENSRYQNIMVQMRNQHSSVLRQWRALLGFYLSERGAWALPEQEELHMKLSSQENFSRMRPKLVVNHNFDQHMEASRLRDNDEEYVEPSPESIALPIEITKEAKVSDEEIGDDRLGDEEWDVISAANTVEKEELTGKEKLVLSEDCELVTIMNVFKGRLEVTTTHIYFFDCSSYKEDGAGEDFKLALSQLREIHFRRYNLRRSALEIFCIDQSNYFLNFDQKVRNKVYSRILSLRPLNLIYYGSRSPAELLKSSDLTKKWVNRDISNFDYLMQLNTIAGRTYNDLSQYPVFPWILSDYDSEELNIDDPKTFRDLSKPIGVVNPNNEKEVREKFDHFEDPTGTIEKFHYGTHYSNPATVMHYLIRMEPYTTLHIQLQSGKFDMADRQFHSVPSMWKTLLENPNDVKELIPEFFYLPEFLENQNRFDLGIMQGCKEPVGDVVLPKWATSPEDFINKHRKALESEYVSRHLHEWIDLIFGYKQKGPAAVEALNVFYYCTYEGAVDLDAVTDPLSRKALEGMINNFGQTPCQLLKEPHPKRSTFEEAVNRATKYDKQPSLLWFLGQLKPFYVEASSDTDPLVYVCVPRNQARGFIHHGMPDSMITVTEDGTLGVHGWLPYDKSISNYFTFEKDPSTNNPRVRLTDALAAGKAAGQKLGYKLLNPSTKKNLAGPFTPGLRVSAKLFIVSHDAKLMFSGGHWDNSLRVYNLSKNKQVAHVVGHKDIVTCLALDHCGNQLITGSRDTTSMIWQVKFNHHGSSKGLEERPLQILYGHDDEVTCVAISVELDLAVSGSKDGSVIIHTVRRGHYMHTLRPAVESGWTSSIQQLAVSDIGDIAVYCTQAPISRPVKEKFLILKPTVIKERLSLHLYSINGKYLRNEAIPQGIGHMCITEGHMIIGNNQGVLIIKELFSLKTLTSLPLRVPIQCVTVTSNNSHILVGLKDGKLIIIGIRKAAEVKNSIDTKFSKFPSIQSIS